MKYNHSAHFFDVHHTSALKKALFWYFSILGGTTLLIYAIHKQDPVFITGQSVGAFVYLRNLMLIYKARKRVPSE